MKNLINEIRHAFNQSSFSYDEHAKIQREIGERLFERLDYLKINPRYILDLGSGTGYFALLLKKRYPKGQIIALDLSSAMLIKGKKRQTWTKKWFSVSGDMHKLPLASGIFDLVFSNQAIHWSCSFDGLFAELHRVMNINGCLMFSSLGPDTFSEIKQAWLNVDTYQHTMDFIDMHDIGDILLRKQFLDPVVDMEKISVHYPSLRNLMDALKSQGVRNMNKSRNPGLTGKSQWQQFCLNYEQLRTSTNKYPLSYEVIYGQGWKGQQVVLEGVQETRIPVEQLIRKRM
jgi:malonyl-CoA O-methyltransferase